MGKTLCILHANCQGDALRPLLENTPAFARLFRIRQLRNYTREAVAERDLAACGLFLHQRLAPRWGELSTERLLPRLSPACRAIILPNLFFKGYWPFWTNAFQGIDFADNMPFGTAADIGIAGHQGNAVYADRKDDRLQSQSCRRQRRFTAGMACANDNHIITLLCSCHNLYPSVLYFPIQKR